MKLINHIEKYLGEIQEGQALEDAKYNVSMSIFKNTPFEQVNTYTSLGLSNYVLFRNNKKYRMEIVFGAENTFDKISISKFLLNFVESLIQSQVSPYKGDFFRFGESIYPQSSMNSLYVTTPIFYPEEFQTLEIKGEKIIFPWVFPIYEQEVDYIIEKGYGNFESLLEEKRVDTFWDLFRESVVP